MPSKKVVLWFLAGVGIFCCTAFFWRSTLIAQEGMAEKDLLAFFADEKGYEFGGVISRTLGEEQVVWLGGPETGRAKINLYSVPEDQFTNALVYPEKKDDDDRYTTKLLPFPIKKEKLNLVTSFEENIQSAATRTRISLPIKKSGLFYLEATMGNRRGEMLLVTSNIVAQAKEEGGKLVIWTADSRTGKHVTSGEIIAYQLVKKKKELERANIDNQGIARITRGEEGDVAWIRSGGEAAFIPLNYASHVPQPVSYGWWGGKFHPYASFAKSYSFTDRMLYQPGDMVYFKSLLRQDDDAVYSIPGGMAKAKVWTGWGQEETVIFEKTMAITASGAVDGNFLIPTDAKTGYYSYSVDYGNLDRNTGWYSYGPSVDTSFVVEHYRKPEFGLDVEVVDDQLIVGDNVEFEIQGTYFSGEPLRGKTVTYTVSAGTYYDSPYFFDGEDAFGDSYRYGGWGGPVVTEKSVTLGNDGKYRVSVPTHPHQNFLPQVYHIQVRGQDSEQNEVYESRNTLVLPGDYSLYRKDFNYGNRAEKEMELLFQVRQNRDNVSLARQFEVKIHHERWIEEGSSGKYPNYRKVEKDLAPGTMQTNEQGEGAFRFTPPEEGSYLLTFLGKDDRGNTIKREIWVWASARDGWFYQPGEGEQNLVSIKTDKEKYVPGEKMEITLTSPLRDREVWLSFERSGVRRFQIVKLDGNTARVAVPVEEGDMPNIFLVATMFSDTSVITNTLEVAVSTEAKHIQVELHPDKEQYQPSETVSLEVFGKDNQGKPVSGEVAIWAIDKALFELMDQAPADVFKTFWSERFHDTTNAHSLEGVLFSLNLAESGGCFLSGTPVLMGDGTRKAIQDVQIGDKVLTRKDLNDASLKEAVVTGTHTVEVDGYLIINDTLRVTPEHKMFVNGSWTAAGSIQVGDKLVGIQGEEVVVADIAFVREKVLVHNLTIDTYHTYFAGDVWVHNNKDGGVRSAFKDTAYWNPRVRLGDNGKARVTFRLPDNTTTWVISGIATAGATQFGQAHQEISVSKNVLVNEALPELMRLGDEVKINVQIRNNTAEKLDFAVRGTFSNGTIVDGAERTITLEGRSTEMVTYTFVPESVNEKATFLVRAETNGKGAEFADAIERTVPIRQKEFVQKVLEAKDGDTSFSLLLPVDADLKRTKVQLEIAPSLLGTLPTAMRGLLDYPYGCVEQTTSRFVPLVIAQKEKGIFKEALAEKNTQEMIEAGVKHLGELQNNNGGWGFWHDDESNPFITSYVVEYLLEARSLGIAQDEITLLLARARGYVEQASREAVEEREKARNVPYSKVEAQDNFMPLISLAYAKSLLGMTVWKDEVQEGVLIPNFSLLSPELLSLAVLTSVRINEMDPAKNGANALVNQSKTDALGWRYWEAGKIHYYASRDAATALALRALLEAKYDREVLLSIVRSLPSTRKAGYWSNTFATAQVVRALVDFFRYNTPEQPNYQYTIKLDGKEIASGRMTSAFQNVVVPIISEKIQPTGSQIEISHEGEGDIYSSLIQRIHRTTESFEGESHGLTLERSYENVSEPRAEPALGDTIRVRLTVTGVQRSHDRLVVEDMLPAGMVPINEGFKNEQGTVNDAQRGWQEGYVEEYKEDGVVMTTYTGQGGKEYKLSYLARVVNAGTYFVPPAYTEFMYSPEAYAYSSSTKMTFPAESTAPPEPKRPFADFLEEKISFREVMAYFLFGVGILSGLGATFLIRRRHQNLG